MGPFIFVLSFFTLITYNDEKCISNIHYMVNKMDTYGYKEKRITINGDLVSFMPIRISMRRLPLYYV